MADEEDKFYSIEDSEPDPPAYAPIPRGRPVDDPDGPADQGVRALDVCPNCGEPMRAKDTLVCLRCGFDLKANRVIETAVGETEIDPEADAEGRAPVPALCKPGNGGLWLAEALAAVCGAAVLVGFLAGATGMFSDSQLVMESGSTAATVKFGTRMLESLRWLIMSTVCVACGVGGLYVLAGLLQKRFGDWKLALARMAAIVMAMSLVRFIDFQRTLEWITETVAQLGVFFGLSIGLFSLQPRDALTLTGIAAAGFVVLCLGSYVVVWAIGAG